ncbi:transmembrane protein 53-A [Parasteatoda tepidariorum]|uniref:transmembrane protein 53-A n=1 Tax=Parasteatoda tepidariorum TaxID=114398 RepID=UPI00077F94B1|nr:transmembrane protein 53-A [Parasteatoda tepidariorum]
MDDDFEYYVTFPVIAEPVVKREPVVILFGWAGCVDRYLAKYSEIYQKKGCTTIRYIASPNIISPRVLDEKKIINLAGNVINLLFDMKFDKHPIFFHTFSNGGATVYRYVSEEIRKNHPNDFKIKGCIFDSCPAKVRVMGFVRATLAMTDGNIIKRYAAAIMAVFRATIAGLYSALFRFFTGKFTTYRVWNALLEEPNVCPQLFLFSKNDLVCCWDTIQEFADLRKKIGVVTKTVLFEESEHVKHMIMYRDEYLKHVYEFIDDYTCDDTVGDN